MQTSALSFARQGTITKIYRRTGERVHAGDVIAEVDAASAYLDIRNAKISLDNANNNYEKLFTINTDADKIRTKNALDEAKSSLILLQAQYDGMLQKQRNDIIQAESQISLLSGSVNLAQNDLEYTKQNLLTNNTANNLARDVANSYVSLEDFQKTLI